MKLLALTLSFEDVGKADSGFQFELYFLPVLRKKKFNLLSQRKEIHFSY